MEKYFYDNLIAQLNCVSTVAALSNNIEIQTLIKMIVDNIRYKNDRKNQIIKIDTELNYVKNLLELFKMRYGERIIYKINKDTNCNYSYIPHYTIMAFVENAVYHAFETKEGEWKIYINIKKDDDVISISIIDNGCGFDIDKYLTKNYRNNSYGTIYSTLRRLYEFNRKSSGVKEKKYEIDSSKGKGTKVSILIPPQI